MLHVSDIGVTQDCLRALVYCLGVTQLTPEGGKKTFFETGIFGLKEVVLNISHRKLPKKRYALNGKLIQKVSPFTYFRRLGN